MRVIVSVLFGSRENAVGWIIEEQLPELPPLGVPVVINIESNGVVSIEGQLYRTWESNEETGEPGGMLIYGGEDIPSKEFQATLEQVGWERLTRDALVVLFAAVQQTPVMAALHDVLIVVGEPEEQENMIAFQRVLRPYDPTMLLFGQRVRLNLANEMNDEEDANQELLTELTSITEDETQTSVEELMRIRDSELEEVEQELEGLISTDNVAKGIPAITIFSTIIRNGTGRIVFWCPKLGNVDPTILIANDWRQVSIPEDFNPQEFRLSDRIALAKRASVTFEPTEFGTFQTKEWSIEDPLSVKDEDFMLMPPVLVENIKAKRDIASIDDYITKWAEEL